MELKPGYKQTEVGVIPEDWESLKVKDLVEREYIDKPLDGNHGNIHPKKSDFVDYGIPFVMANDIKDGKIDFSNCSFITIKQANTLQKGFSVTGDVLLTHKGTVGNTAIVGKISTPFIMLTPQVTYYRIISREHLDNHYLRHYFDGYKFQTILKNYSGGGTRAYIGITKQADLPIVLPPSKFEQTAIANALSHADALIQSLTRLIAKKRQIKQGAMQTLLNPYENGRLKEGWVVKKIGSFTDATAGGTPSTLVDEYWGGDIKWMSSGELNKKRVYDVLGRITEEGLKNSATKIIPTKCVLIGLAGQGKTRGTVAMNFVELCTNQSIAAIFPCTTVSTEFLYFNLDKRYEELRNLSTGDGGRGGLNLRIIKNLDVWTPEKLEEQLRIATILSDMDAEIAALETKLAKYRHIKQGMMQNLLTGRIRLI